MSDIKIVVSGVCAVCKKKFDHDDQGNMSCDCPKDIA